MAEVGFAEPHSTSAHRKRRLASNQDIDAIDRGWADRGKYYRLNTLVHAPPLFGGGKRFQSVLPALSHASEERQPVAR